MPLQHGHKLLLKRLASMMRDLITNISTNGNDLRLAHAERGVPFLPTKSLMLFHFMNPFGSIRFDQTQHVGDRQHWLEFRQQMDMIFDPANF